MRMENADGERSVLRVAGWTRDPCRVRIIDAIQWLAASHQVPLYSRVLRLFGSLTCHYNLACQTLAWAALVDGSTTCRSRWLEVVVKVGVRFGFGFIGS